MQENNPVGFFMGNMLTFLTQIRTFHQQITGNDAEPKHRALGDFYDLLSDKLDEFVECYQGKYGRIIKFVELKLNLFDLERVNVLEFLNVFHKYLSDEIYNNEKVRFMTDEDLDLQDIIIDILNGINKLKYLYNLTNLK